MLDPSKAWDYIESYHTTGTIHRAHKMWSEIKSVEFRKINEKIVTEKNRATAAESRADAAEKREHAILENVKNHSEKEQKLIKQISKLEEHVTATEATIVVLEQKEQEVHNRVSLLEGRGLTVENLDPVLKSDAHSPAELMERVSTKEEFLGLCDEVTQLTDLRDSMIHEVEEETAKRAEIREARVSEENQLDQVKTEHIHWQDAVNLLIYGFKRGYNLSIIKGLISALLRFGIKDQPGVSARRLINGLEKVGELIELEDAVKKTEAHLRILEGERDQTQGQLLALRDGVLGSISMAFDNSIRGIENFTKDSKGCITELVSAVKQVESQSIDSIKEVQAETDNVMTMHRANVGRFFINNSTAAQLAIELWEAKIREYGDLKEEFGEIRPWMNLASLLYGTYNDPSSLQSANLSVVRRLCEGIHMYIAGKWVAANVRVPMEVSDNDFGIFTGSVFRLLSISTLLLEGLRQLERQGNQ
ncbi:coiled-coil domain-containing protein [Thermoproteota archaeon]